jgi:DNA-binding NtrC family response regulator
MRILIVGPLNGQIAAATKMAMDRGAKVAQVDSIAQATATLRGGRGADLLMVDIALDIAGLIAANEAERIRVPVVACGVNVDARAAAAAIRAGAKEFIPLPPEAELIAAVLAAVSDDERPMIADDPAMKKTIELADQIAASDASILITGESGVGKEVMARYVHRNSKRRDAPFIAVNCAAIPDNLLESELFGHEKGAFTGAVGRRIGKFEEAHGGTLLLDEISEMDARLQAKLLRALQERQIDRVGGGKPVPVDIRIIATSNRDLGAAVREGAFRQDLLYRLNVVNLHIPPLRERRKDLPALARFFIEKYAIANGKAGRRLTAGALEQVENHPWRGNVRELENAMHRAVLLSNDVEIGPEAIRAPDGGMVDFHTDDTTRRAAEVAARTLVGKTVAEVEQDLILETLSHCLGNRTHAALILGISIRTLRNKLKQYSDEGVAVPPPAVGSAA